MSQPKPRKLRKKLRDLKVNQTEIVRRTGLSPSHVCRAVNGERYSPTVLNCLHKIEAERMAEKKAAQRAAA